MKLSKVDPNYVLAGSIPNPEAKPFSADGTALISLEILDIALVDSLDLQ